MSDTNINGCTYEHDHDPSCNREIFDPYLVPSIGPDSQAPGPAPLFVGHVSRPGVDLFPAISLPRLPTPVPMTDMSLALLKSVFQAISPHQAFADLKNEHTSSGTESQKSFPFSWNYRVCRPSAEPTTAATTVDTESAGRDELLQSAISRQGLVQLKTEGEKPLSDICSEVLKGANGKGVKLNNQLSIQSIKKATTYPAAADGIPNQLQSTRTRWVVSVYDADLKDTFELPLTEIHLAENSPEAFNANLPFVKEAMDAHLNAIHWAYKDSVTQPTVMSLAVPEWAGLLASFEDTQMRIQSNMGYSVGSIQEAVSLVYGAFGQNQTPDLSAEPPVLLRNMLKAMLQRDSTPPDDESAIAVLSPQLIKLDRMGPENGLKDGPNSGSGIGVTQSADWIRRSRYHARPASAEQLNASTPASQRDDLTPPSSPRRVR